MDKINELVEMAQVLSAVMDEAGVESFSANAGYIDRAGFVMSPTSFFKTFRGFRIEVREADQRFKFRLSKEIQGVEFVTYTEDLTGLKIVKLMQLNQVRIKRHKKSLQRTAMRVSN